MKKNEKDEQIIDEKKKAKNKIQLVENILPAESIIINMRWNFGI